MKDVAILDYCSGNIASLFSAFRSINADPYLASTKDDLRSCAADYLWASSKINHSKSQVDTLYKLIRKMGIPGTYLRILFM